MVSKRGRPRRRLASFWGASSALASFGPYAYVAPALLLFGLFILWPFFQNILISFTSWDGYSPTRSWIGLTNYFRALNDPALLTAVRNNAIWAAFSILVPVAIGLFLAVELHQLPRLAPLFRGAFFAPTVLSLAVVALIWAWIYNPLVGLLTSGLKAAGWDHLVRVWLGDSSTALLAALVAGSWRYVGFCVVIFLAGLSQIPEELLDAALVDGATGWKRFRYVTFPLLSDTTYTLLIYTSIASFEAFDLVWILTRGGPNYSSTILATEAYRRAFRQSLFGYGAAIGVVLFAIVLVLTIVYFVALRKRYRV